MAKIIAKNHIFSNWNENLICYCRHWLTLRMTWPVALHATVRLSHFYYNYFVFFFSLSFHIVRATDDERSQCYYTAGDLKFEADCKMCAQSATRVDRALKTNSLKSNKKKKIQNTRNDTTETSIAADGRSLVVAIAFFLIKNWWMFTICTQPPPFAACEMRKKEEKKNVLAILWIVFDDTFHFSLAIVHGAQWKSREMSARDRER